MKKIILLSSFIFSAVMLHAQNIGIGTTNPFRAKLELHGRVGGTSGIFGADSAGISLQSNWPGIGFNQFYGDMSRHLANGYSAVQYLDPNSGYMGIDMLGTGGAYNYAGPSLRAITFLPNGNVGIRGNGSLNSSLFVEKGNNNATASFLGSQYHSHFNNLAQENTYIRAGKNNGIVYINDIPGSKISMSGFVGINTDNPLFPLDIRQPAEDRGLSIRNINNNYFWEWRVTGTQGVMNMYHNTHYTGSFNQWGVYSYVSDRRLKTNIKPLPSLLDKIMKLQPVEYEMTRDNPSHEKSMGFIAQDVKKIFPELVNVAKDSTSGYDGLKDLHTVNYGGLSILAIKAIQEQQQQLNGLKKEIELLKEQNRLYRQLLQNK